MNMNSQKPVPGTFDLENAEAMAAVVSKVNHPEKVAVISRTSPTKWKEVMPEEYRALKRYSAEFKIKPSAQFTSV